MEGFDKHSAILFIYHDLSKNTFEVYSKFDVKLWSKLLSAVVRPISIDVQDYTNA